jgi:hypothetical protein
VRTFTGAPTKFRLPAIGGSGRTSARTFIPQEPPNFLGCAHHRGAPPNALENTIALVSIVFTSQTPELLAYSVIIVRTLIGSEIRSTYFSF